MGDVGGGDTKVVVMDDEGVVDEGTDVVEPTNRSGLFDRDQEFEV
jgi:hypothetical protein